MIQCGMEYYLYWWRDHNHTDPLTEGYIGITRKLDQRIQRHKTEADWYRDDLEMHILYSGLSKEKAEELENKYRPTTMIGWNIIEGGNLPPVHEAGSRSEKWRKKLCGPRERREVGKNKKWSDEYKLYCIEYVGKGKGAQERCKEIGITYNKLKQFKRDVRLWH